MITLALELAAVLLLASCEPKSLPDLRLSQGETKFNLDMIDGQTVDRASEIVVDSSKTSECSFAGWAIDLGARKLAGGVLLVIDRRRLFGANYGTPRDDIVDHYKEPAYLDCGFERRIDTAALGRGRHFVSVVILAADGRAAYRPSEEWAFTVR